MQFNLKVIGVGDAEQKTSPKNGKTYTQIEFTYKDLGQDKTVTKKIMSFDKAIYNVVADAKPGQQYCVTAEKEGDYWNWKSIATGSGASEPAPASTGKAFAGGGKSTYDADRQLSIVRQSTLKAAVDWCKDREGLTLTDVFTTAKMFQDYVFGNEFDIDSVPDPDPNNGAEIPF